MSQSGIETLVDALNARFTNPERNKVIGGRPGETPRFELYHFHLSLCSYKLRTVLAEKGAAYFSHDIDIFPPEIQNYFPEYVRLRLEGREDKTGDLVNGYTGRSSTETEGFDPCVVPTLVDHEAGQVLANSKRVCIYLDSVLDSGTKLIPEDIRDAVIQQVDIVDRTPHVAVLYGPHPDEDRRPAFMHDDMVVVHDAKIAKCRENMASVDDDPALVAAYEHKIVKEAAAKQFVRTERDMRGAIQEFKNIIAQLDKDLEATGGEWMFGDRFTLADVFWAVSLFRIRWLGLGYLFESEDSAQYSPRIMAYCGRLMDRPSFRLSVIEWPLHPPSEHLPEYYEDAPESASSLAPATPG